MRSLRAPPRSRRLSTPRPTCRSWPITWLSNQCRGYAVDSSRSGHLLKNRWGKRATLGILSQSAPGRNRTGIDSFAKALTSQSRVLISGGISQRERALSIELPGLFASSVLAAITPFYHPPTSSLCGGILGLIFGRFARKYAKCKSPEGELLFYSPSW